MTRSQKLTEYRGAISWWFEYSPDWENASVPYSTQHIKVNVVCFSIRTGRYGKDISKCKATWLQAMHKTAITGESTWLNWVKKNAGPRNPILCIIWKVKSLRNYSSSSRIRGSFNLWGCAQWLIRVECHIASERRS